MGDKSGQHKTGIEWTHVPGFIGATLNSATGCSRVSPGCQHCYALTLHDRRHASYVTGGGFFPAKDGQPGRPIPAQYAHPFEWRPAGPGTPVQVQLHPERLRELARWRKPHAVFMDSVSDLFHESVPWSHVAEVFDAMYNTPQHLYFILTKRPERMASYVRLSGRGVPPNLALGTSVESMQYAHRVEHLAAIRSDVPGWLFVSGEPMLGSLAELDMGELDWLILGWESGSGARPWRKHWANWRAGRITEAQRDEAFAREREQLEDWTAEAIEAAQRVQVPVFYKQAATPAGHALPLPKLFGDRQWVEWLKVAQCVGCHRVLHQHHDDMHRCEGLPGNGHPTWHPSHKPAQPCGAWVCSDCLDHNYYDAYGATLCPTCSPKLSAIAEAEGWLNATADGWL